MKRLWGVLGREMFVKYYQSYHSILLSCLCIFPIFLAACGGKLGTIEVQDVDTLLSQTEEAINSAREVNAPSLAFEEFEKAETELEKAREALRNNNGVDALRYANQAITHAKIAKREALQNTMNAEANANILAKDARIVELRKKITEKETKISDLENGIEQLRDTEKKLAQTIRTLETEKDGLINTRKINEQKVAELNESLKSIQARVASSEIDVRNYGVQVKELSRKLEVTEIMANSASKQKRAAIAEAESLRKQMREQAKIYTDKLAAANKRNVVAEHAEYVKRQEEKARTFEKQLHSNEPKRTGRTSLSTEQINAGKAALRKWEKSWTNKNLDAHLAFYAPNFTANKILIVESKENPSVINRSQIESNLREMNAQPWKKIKESTEVEQESVIGIFRFSRLVSPAQTEDDTALYHSWTREIWMHQVQGDWKIYRETWQIYENVPDLRR